MPLQPEFIVLNVQKSQNGTPFLAFADIHSDNNRYFDKANASIYRKMKNWFQCNNNDEFGFETIDEANEICRKMASSIKTYYSEV